MKLPRRIPWASIGELDQLCSWIFSDENDLETKVLAINRLSAWRASTALPHALESTLALLVVILQDSSPQTSSGLSYLSVRQSYAAAIIRLVNGLVDPLQLGAYARSIASIAAQLGLPAWLVELRHAATHEDLPSLELLREADRESMSWLLHNYFLPTINPSTVPRSQPTQLRSLAPILKQYKTLLKITTRDASLRTQYKPAITEVLKAIQRWVAEAKVAANVAIGEFGWGASGSGSLDVGGPDNKERWALDRLCDALLEKGSLVPLSKKKRIFPTDTFSPPKFSILLWTPLLTHLQIHHPDILGVLCNRIVSYLLSDIPTPDDGPLGTGPLPPDTYRRDLSFDMCLARWAMWLIDTCRLEDAESEIDLKKDVIVSLITAFGPGANDSSRDRQAARALLQALSAGNPEIEATLALLLHPVDSLPSGEWRPDDIAVMNQRLNALLSLEATGDATEAQSPPQPTANSHMTPVTLAPGWRLLDGQGEWKPSPIGVHVPTNAAS